MKKWGKASFTVEYTLILPFVFLVIFFIIFSGFYLHDQVVLEAMTLESLMTDESENINWSELAKKYTFCTKNLTFQVSNQLTTVKTFYQTRIKIPYQTEFQIQGSQEANKYAATNFIRVYRQSVVKK